MSDREMFTCPACRGSGQVSVQPKTIKRDRDLGWLAVSPDGYKYRIGVEGETEAEAIVKWYEVATRWEELGRLAVVAEEED